MGARVSPLQPGPYARASVPWANSPRWLICYKDDHSQNTSFEKNWLDLICCWFLSHISCLSIWQLVCLFLDLCLAHTTICTTLKHVSADYCAFFSLHLNWLLFLCRSHLAVDMAGGASERTAGWCLRRVSRGSPGSDQAIRPAAADHPAGNSQRYKGRRGPHTTAQVIIY